MRIRTILTVLACASLVQCAGAVNKFAKIDTPKKVTFICRAGKSIQATFYPGDDTRVDLKLSDGRSLSVPRAISGSGARYASTDERFVFWNKGNTGFVTEGSPDQETYSGCVVE